MLVEAAITEREEAVELLFQEYVLAPEAVRVAEVFWQTGDEAPLIEMLGWGRTVMVRLNEDVQVPRVPLIT